MGENQRQRRLGVAALLAFILLIVTLIPIITLNLNSSNVVYYIMLDLFVIFAGLILVFIIDHFCCNQNETIAKKDNAMMMKAIKKNNRNRDRGYKDGKSGKTKKAVSSRSISISFDGNEDGIYSIDAGVPYSIEVGDVSTDAGGGGGGDFGGGCDSGGCDSGGCDSGGGTCD